MKSTVLLIDDDQDVLDSYLHLMSIDGLTAKAVIDPTQAMSHIQPDWNGVVLLDMYMPQLHGMELLKQIKAVDEKIPVIGSQDTVISQWRWKRSKWARVIFSKNRSILRNCSR